MNSRPNIVCIISDDTSPNYIGAYGSSYLTPNIDQLAEDGIRFNNAQVSTPICTPSRYSYLSGKFPSSCTHDSFKKNNPEGEIPIINFNSSIQPGETHLPTILKANNYATCYVGKFHCGRNHTEIGHEPIPENGDPHNPEADRIRKSNQQKCVDELNSMGWDTAYAISWGNIDDREPQEGKNHNQEWITDGALNFLEEQKDSENPFCLYMATQIVHSPDHGPAMIDLDPKITYGGILDCAPDVQPPRSSIAKRLEEAGVGVTHRTFGMLWLDDAIGAVTSKLKEIGADENTIIIYKVDHNVIGKWSLYENGTRVPLIWRLPKKQNAGHLARPLVQNVDFLPTIAELCNLDHFDPASVDGASYASVLNGSQEEIHDDMYFEYGMKRAVRTKRWKYIAFRHRPDQIEAMKTGKSPAISPLGRPNLSRVYREQRNFWAADQLYDLWTDPEEQFNLAENPVYADILADMKKRLRARIEKQGHHFPEEADPFHHSEHYQLLTRAQTLADQRMNFIDGSTPEKGFY